MPGADRDRPWRASSRDEYGVAGAGSGSSLPARPCGAIPRRRSGQCRAIAASAWRRPMLVLPAIYRSRTDGLPPVSCRPGSGRQGIWSPSGWFPSGRRPAVAISSAARPSPAAPATTWAFRGETRCVDGWRFWTASTTGTRAWLLSGRAAAGHCRTRGATAAGRGPGQPAAECQADRAGWRGLRAGAGYFGGLRHHGAGRGAGRRGAGSSRLR